MHTFDTIALQHSGATDLAIPGYDAVLEYLAKRGIRPEQIDELGIKVVPAQELIQSVSGRAAFDNRLAVVFPHWRPGGAPIDWWSARLVEWTAPPVLQGFQALITQRARGKMFCPPGEVPHAYFAAPKTWETIKEGETIYIHESVIKAINGANLGYKSIGLNGVWGWCSKKHDVSLLEELRSLPWKGKKLKCVIVFDSNAATNDDVKLAISKLSERILDICKVHPVHLDLPMCEDGTHWGFDDYCVELGPDAARAYLKAAAESEAVPINGVAVMKMQLNTEVCVIRNLSMIAEQSTGTLMSRGQFTTVNYAHRICEDAEGKKINVPAVWLMDEKRTEVEKLEYVPGGPLLQHGEFLNLWRGMGVEPDAGVDIRPWLDLVTMGIEDPAQREWVLDWLAWPLQNLGGKMNTFLHIFGSPGTGKNAVLDPVKRIYGSNAITIGKDDMVGPFNSIVEGKQFVNLDEVHGGADSMKLANRIKMFVTDATLVVKKKNVQEYTIRNCANLVTTANYSDSLRMDAGDRRACVLRFGPAGGWAQRGVGPLWERYWAWVHSGGAAGLYAWLLKRQISPERFDPYGVAPWSETKEMVMEAAMDPITRWVSDLRTLGPDAVLPPIMAGRRFLTAEQTAQAYLMGTDSKDTPGLRVQIGVRLADAGFKRTPLIKVNGRPVRVWVIHHGADMPDNKEVQAELGALKGQ